jgi:cyclophilin family peptidyl-prolyl cis-trans isomerase
MRQVKVEQVQKHKRRSRRLRRALGALVIVAALVGVIALVSQHPRPTAFTAVAPTCLPKGETVSKSRHVNFTGTPPMCISAKATYAATVKTDLGSFVISMPASRSPKAVNNFVFLAGYRFFDGTKFFRAVPGTLVQGGSPTGKASGEAGYSWLSEPPKSSCAANKSCYPTWSVLYANRENKKNKKQNENGSQFFVVLPKYEAVIGGDPIFTSFGRVISGWSVLKAIAKDGTAGGTPSKTHRIISVTITKVAS